MERLADHANQIRRLYYEEKRSYAEIGSLFGELLRPDWPREQRQFSREAVRQILEASFPDRPSGLQMRKQIHQATTSNRLLRELVSLLSHAVPCPVCGYWVVRQRRDRHLADGSVSKRTCSAECSRE